MKLQPIQPRWKQNFRIVASLALVAFLTVMVLGVIRDRKNKTWEVKAPIPGAVMLGELQERKSDLSVSYNTGNYTLLNDGKQGLDDIVLVLMLWNYGDAPDSFALKPGESWQVEKTIVQNWYGHLILWQLPPDPTPTAMPTVQLGDPCTLSFVTCPATPTP